MLYLSAIVRHIVAKFGNHNTFSLRDLRVHTNKKTEKQTDMVIWTWLLTLIKNRYILCLHLPVINVLNKHRALPYGYWVHKRIKKV